MKGEVALFTVLLVLYAVSSSDVLSSSSGEMG